MYVMWCRDWKDKHTCPLYIAFCSGLGHQHTKGADGSRYQSIYETTEPSQPMMSDDVSNEDRPQHRELRPLLFSNSVGSLTSHRVICEQGLRDGTSGLSSLSEKTLKSNHLQMSLQRQHFLLSYIFKEPESWSGRDSNSRPPARPSPNWANRVAGIYM